MTAAARYGAETRRAADGDGNGAGRPAPRAEGAAVAPARGEGPPSDPVLLDRAAAEGWSLRRLERAYILHVLQRHDGHRGNTAEALGIDRRTLYRKLKEYEAEAR